MRKRKDETLKNEQEEPGGTHENWFEEMYRIWRAQKTIVHFWLKVYANISGAEQVTGTGGGTSIRKGEHIFLAPSGVQKELMQPTDLFVMDFATKEYLRKPQV